MNQEVAAGTVRVLGEPLDTRESTALDENDRLILDDVEHAIANDEVLRRIDLPSSGSRFGRAGSFCAGTSPLDCTASGSTRLFGRSAGFARWQISSPPTTIRAGRCRGAG